jgi:trehalose/maltose hydrolase-like predicted phosphorylase
MSEPVSPPPVTTALPDDLPPYVSNGLIGLRVLDIPLLSGFTLVNGFAGIDPVVRVGAAARAPYPLAGDLALDGVWLRTFPNQAEFVDQRYDFASGELTTRFRFAAGGKLAEVEVLTFCSRTAPTLALQEVAVRVDTACQLTLRALVDPEQVPGRIAARHVEIPDRGDPKPHGSLSWQSLGGKSECGLAYGTEATGAGMPAPSVVDWGVDTRLATEYSVAAKPGRTYRLRQIVSLVASVLHHQPEAEAVRLAAAGMAEGFEELRADNRRAWEELWKGRVVIDSADESWQALADAAFFYLNSSTHASAPSSTSIYGLAQWHDYHYYYGHVMWDIEAFSLPPLLLSQPDAARSLLDFRSQTLLGARSNAKLRGRKGLQFPWESDWLRGEEVAPGIGRASWHEDHITLDVALAFARYGHATGDSRFLSEDLPAVLHGVAEWIVSRVSRTRAGFAFRDTMGIAERVLAADNDAFTVMSAKVALREAIAAVERIGQAAPAAWREVDAGLEVRPSKSNGAIMSHDGYRPTEQKGATPGPLAGLFPVWYELDPRVAQATLEYYLKLAPAYVGSPMLSALYPTWAAWAGDRRLAAQLMREGYAELVGGRFLQTFEQHPVRFPEKPRSGPFFANLGGFLMTLMYGLPGIRIGPEAPAEWPRRPVVLPAGWRSIEIERAWVRQQAARIEAKHGAATARVAIEGN